MTLLLLRLLIATAPLLLLVTLGAVVAPARPRSKHHDH
jgi:hypothetical protein